MAVSVNCASLTLCHRPLFIEHNLAFPHHRLHIFYAKVVNTESAKLHSQNCPR